MFVGLTMLRAQGNKKYISIDQKLCVSELEEIVIPKHLKDADACDKALHTSYRSLLGSINWLQSSTLASTSVPPPPLRHRLGFVAAKQVLSTTLS